MEDISNLFDNIEIVDNTKKSEPMGDVVEPKGDTEVSTESKEEKPKSEKKKNPEPFPKKDLGMGGASFCDELLKTASESILAKIKSGEKTMAGCWNWVYSHVKNEYIKQNGMVSGGVGGEMSSLIEKYFNEIPEGTMEEEEKPKPVAAPKEIVEKVAKKAAKAAKRANTKKAKAAEVKTKSETKGEEIVIDDKNKNDIVAMFEGVDF